MSFRIQESFEIAAPVERVWAYVTDPRRVVTCLPGAELTAVESDTTFLGKVKVKVGPVVAAYSGKVTLTEQDETAHRVRLVGEGRESSGSGSAKMTMTSTLTALATGATEVHLTADLDVVGKLAQFGRGMIENVNKQMLKQFTDCARIMLETAEMQAVATRAATIPTTTTATATTAASTAAATTTPLGGSYAPPVKGAPTLEMQAPPVAPSQPVRLLPVLRRAIWATLVAFLRRLWRLVTFEGRRGGS